MIYQASGMENIPSLFFAYEVAITLKLEGKNLFNII